MPAIVDICLRFPTLPSCQDLIENTTIVAAINGSDFSVTNFTATTSVPQSIIDDYCTRYLKHFEFFCLDASKSYLANEFCTSYVRYCLKWNQISGINTTSTINVATAATTAAIPTPLSAGTNNSTLNYCVINSRDYTNLCLHDLVLAFAVKFCAGYYEACPNVPAPGSGPPISGTNRFQTNVVPIRKQNGFKVQN